jgi:curved DNA-binding protein CbpA
VPIQISVSRSHYDVLGVTPEFPIEAVDGLRRTLSKLYHPDAGSHPNAARMAVINEACDVLGDRDQRLRYNADLAQGRVGRARKAVLFDGPLRSGSPRRPDVHVILTPTRLIGLRIEPRQYVTDQVAFNLPLCSITAASRQPRARLQHRWRLEANDASYLWVNGWDALAPLIREQLGRQGLAVADTGPDAWAVAPAGARRY